METQFEYKLTVDQVLYTSELLARRNCSLTENYEECEKDNRDYFNRTFRMLSRFVVKDTIIESIAQTTNSTLYALLFVQDLYALSNNFHCADPNNFEDVFNYIEASVKQTKNIVQLIQPTNEDTIIDVVKYLAASAVNLIDWLTYGEALGIVKKNDKGLIEDERVERVKNLTHETLMHLWSTSEKYFNYDRFHYKVEKRDLELELGRRLRRLDETDWAHNIIFDTLNIKVTYREKLFNDGQAEISTIYCYEKYPLFSNQYNNGSFHIVGMKMYNKEYKEITNLTSISSGKRPIVIFDSQFEGSDTFTDCKLVSKNEMTTTGVTSSTNTDADSKKTYITCTLSSLGEVGVTIKVSSSSLWLIILLSIAGVALLAALGYFIITLVKKKRSAIPPLDNNNNGPLMEANE